MSPWVLRGLREGVVTTRWPARPDPYADGWRGPATVLDPRPASTADLSFDLSHGRHRRGADLALSVDQGRCILCGRCTRDRPDVFSWSHGAARPTLTRTGLVVPEVDETERAWPRDQVGTGGPDRRAAPVGAPAPCRRRLGRHRGAGDRGAAQPVYDIHRLGIFFTASPRHADVLLVTGAGAHGMAEPLRRTYAGMPDPKIVIAVGTDAVSGGLLGGSAGRRACRPPMRPAGGVGAVVPVDVWVPGSPPPPFAILHALLAGLGRLPDRQESEGARL